MTDRHSHSPASLRLAAAAIASSLALISCAEHSTRYPPALPISTQAFPNTWEQGERPSANGNGPAADPAQPPVPSQTTQPAQTQAQGPLVAVLEFRNRLQGDDKIALDTNYLSNAVRAAVKRTRPEARLMTEENIQVLLASAHKTLDDCQGECEVDTGRLLGADLIITGDMLRFGTKLKLDMRMHETKSGQLVSGSDASGKTVDDLDEDLPRAVKELMAGLR